MADETAVILPPGVTRPREESSAHVVVDNRTGLPDQQVQEAVETFWVEHASLGGLKYASSFQTYANNGSMLARRQYLTPTTRREEIALARELADRDDDISNAIGQALAIAFSEGFENHTRDDKTAAIFDAIAEDFGGSRVLKKLYREYLIAGSVTTVMLPVRKRLDVRPLDDGPAEEQPLVSVKLGVIPAEFIEPLDNDLFDDSALGYIPQTETERKWLEEFFSDSITPARKAAMRREDPVAATLYVERVELDGPKEDLLNRTQVVYRLNPRLAARTSMPKGGSERHACPPIARDFALLEAKRLLNIMDYALLQGASNYIVVAKKGTDERPAQPAEVQNLEAVVRRASRTGVIVGDHRLSFEILTPNLEGLLHTEKRRLLSRKLAAAVLRLPEPNAEGAGVAGMEAELEFLARVIASDRFDVKEHVEKYVYGELAKRNDAIKGAAELWFPKIVLQGTNYFTDYVLKLRDRGDIPRKFAVQAAGFNWEAGIAQRKRELEENVDEVMAPAAVPFTDQAGPQDNNEGRPTGGSSANGAPGSDPSRPRDNVRPLRTINRSAGETVKAYLESGETVRAGEQTYAILEQYPDAEPGRVTALERRALEVGVPTTEGPIAVVPVNPGYEVDEVRAQRLAPGLSLLWGHRRGDRAVVAKALAFRRPEFDLLEAEETALRWGFPIAGWEEMEELARLEPPPAKEEPPAATANGQPIEVHVHGAAGRTRRVLVRDKDGNVIGSEEQPIEDDEQ